MFHSSFRRSTPRLFLAALVLATASSMGKTDANPRNLFTNGNLERGKSAGFGKKRGKETLEVGAEYARNGRYGLCVSNCRSNHGTTQRTTGRLKDGRKYYVEGWFRLPSGHPGGIHIGSMMWHKNDKTGKSDGARIGTPVEIFPDRWVKFSGVLDYRALGGATREVITFYVTDDLSKRKDLETVSFFADDLVLTEGDKAPPAQDAGR